MRYVLFLLLLTAGATGVRVAMPELPLAVIEEVKSHDGLQRFPAAERLVALQSYTDNDYGFSVAIPSGWQKIVSVDEVDLELLEPGYAVGFESPNQGGGDHFADYIMIEILPGKDSGVFHSDGVNRKQVSIDGKSAWIDSLKITGAGMDLEDVILSVYQAEIIGLGYTIGLYAIGDQARDGLMAAAFEVMVRTFRLTGQPFATA